MLNINEESDKTTGEIIINYYLMIILMQLIIKLINW